MVIDLNDQEIQDGVNSVAVNAVKEGLKSYPVRSAIEQMVSKVIIEEVMGKAMIEAVGKIDLSTISNAMAKEIARSTVSSVQLVIRDALMSTVLKIRGISEYDSEKRRVAIEEIKKELKE